MKASQGGDMLKQIYLSQNSPCSSLKCHKRLAFCGNTVELTDRHDDRLLICQTMKALALNRAPNIQVMNNTA